MTQDDEKMLFSRTFKDESVFLFDLTKTEPRMHYEIRRKQDSEVR